MNLNCLDDLVGLAEIQKARVLRLRERERESNVPLPSLNRAINDYRRLLLSIQKISVTPGVRARSPSVTRPDDLKNQELSDACYTANEILRKVRHSRYS